MPVQQQPMTPMPFYADPNRFPTPVWQADPSQVSGWQGQFIQQIPTAGQPIDAYQQYPNGIYQATYQQPAFEANTFYTGAVQVLTPTNARPPSVPNQQTQMIPQRPNSNYAHTPSPGAQTQQQAQQQQNQQQQNQQQQNSNRQYQEYNQFGSSASNEGSQSRPSSVSSVVNQNPPTPNQNYNQGGQQQNQTQQSQQQAVYTTVSTTNFSPSTNQQQTQFVNANSGNGQPGYPQVNTSSPQVVSHNSSGYSGSEQYSGQQNQQQWQQQEHQQMMWEQQQQQQQVQENKMEHQNYQQQIEQQNKHAQYMAQQQKDHSEHNSPTKMQSDNIQRTFSQADKVNLNTRIKTMILNKQQNDAKMEQEVKNVEQNNTTGHFLWYSHHHHLNPLVSVDGGPHENNHPNRDNSLVNNSSNNTQLFAQNNFKQRTTVLRENHNDLPLRMQRPLQHNHAENNTSLKNRKHLESLQTNNQFQPYCHNDQTNSAREFQPDLIPKTEPQDYIKYENVKQEKGSLESYSSDPESQKYSYHQTSIEVKKEDDNLTAENLTQRKSFGHQILELKTSSDLETTFHTNNQISPKYTSMRSKDGLTPNFSHGSKAFNSHFQSPSISKNNPQESETRFSNSLRPVQNFNNIQQTGTPLSPNLSSVSSPRLGRANPAVNLPNQDYEQNRASPSGLSKNNNHFYYPQISSENNQYAPKDLVNITSYKKTATCDPNSPQMRPSSLINKSSISCYSPDINQYYQDKDVLPNQVKTSYGKLVENVPLNKDEKGKKVKKSLLEKDPKYPFGLHYEGYTKSRLSAKPDKPPPKIVGEEIPPCHCFSPDQSPPEPGTYYTHLGCANNLRTLRHNLECQTGVNGSAIRIEKVRYTGKEGKTAQGCPIVKWVHRRVNLEEKYLVIVKHRIGHFCQSAFIVICLVVWDGVSQTASNDLYTLLTEKLNKFGLPTKRRCATNDPRTCACQGINEDTCGASFTFGCSWSMYYNGCKFTRSKDVRKFRLSVKEEETELEEKMQNLADHIGPIYKQIAPQSFANQTRFENVASECRIGTKPGRPFASVTACMDFCAHSHKDIHNMNNGVTVVVTLTKHRDLLKPDDEQLHVLPLYVSDDTDEFGSKDNQGLKAKMGTVEVLEKYECEVRTFSEPAEKCKIRRGKKEEGQRKRKSATPQLSSPSVSSTSHQQTPNSSPLPHNSSEIQSGQVSSTVLDAPNRLPFWRYDSFNSNYEDSNGVHSNGNNFFSHLPQFSVFKTPQSYENNTFSNHYSQNGVLNNYSIPSNSYSSVNGFNHPTPNLLSHSITHTPPYMVSNPFDDVCPSNMPPSPVATKTANEAKQKLVDISYTDNSECFRDSEVGGVAIALTHGSILFECAKHELHATTALKKPDRTNPTRISLVFYQHRNLNKSQHGLDEYTLKQKSKLDGFHSDLAETDSSFDSSLNSSFDKSFGEVAIKTATLPTFSTTTMFPMYPCMVTGPYQEHYGGTLSMPNK